jgi:predicted DNA-binding transcriptional regulator AlpA
MPRLFETIMFANDPAQLEATLTLENLVEIYCVSRRTIWRWVAEGKIPRPYAVTRRVRRWKASEIRRHLDELPQCHLRNGSVSDQRPPVAHTRASP